MTDLMVIAPWSTHLSITFFFSGSLGVNFGPPGINTWMVMVIIRSLEVEDGETSLVNVENLLMGLVDRVPVVDQDRHGASRVDIAQVLNALMRIIDDIKYFFTVNRKFTFVSHPPLEGSI